MGHASRRREPAAETAIEFCRALARTLGPAYRLSLYDRRPARLVQTWGRPGRARDPDPVARLVESGASVVNHSLGKGGRLTVLPLAFAGEDGLALAIEVDTAAFARVSRLLADLAQPDGAEPEPDHLGDALSRMVDTAAERVGVPIGEMSRAQKQQVVKYLDERGAFLIKKAVEQVAGRLGVSRFTIYNYLDQTNRSQ